MQVRLRDPRLPANPWNGAATDPEKEKFGAESKIELLDSTGSVVSVQVDLYAAQMQPLTLSPGDYTVRLLLRGESPQEQRCSVKAGDQTSVFFPPR